MFLRLVCQSGFFNRWTTNWPILSLQLSLIWTGLHNNCQTTCENCKLQEWNYHLNLVLKWKIPIRNHLQDTLKHNQRQSFTGAHSIEVQDYLVSFGESGAGMLTSRTSQRQKNPASSFKGSKRLENCKLAKSWQRTKLQANPPATNTQAIKVQAPLSKFKHLFKFEHFFEFCFVWTILI